MPDAATYRWAVSRAQSSLSAIIANNEIELESSEYSALLAAAADIVWDAMIIAVGLDPEDFPF